MDALNRRKVLIERKTWKKHPGGNLGKAEWEEVGEATFCDFAIDAEELQNGVANYPCAIVEWPDGRIEVFPLSGSCRVRFTS